METIKIRGMTDITEGDRSEMNVEGIDMEEPEIVNIVASASLGVELNLADLADEFPRAEYDKSRFPGLIYRLEEPKVALLLFSSGKLVCTGARRLEQTRKGVAHILGKIRDFFEKLRPGEADKVPEKAEVRVQNIVATGSLNTRINLIDAAIYLPFDRVEYEPEQFPGLVYRPKDVGVVALLFGSGKIVCTGATNTKDIRKAVKIIVKELTDIDLI